MANPQFPPHDVEFDESRGGNRDHRNLISAPTQGYVYKATKEIWPWKPATHEAGRLVLPSVFLENLVRSATVDNPEAFRTDRYLTKALDIDGFVADALWTCSSRKSSFIA